VCEVAPTGLWVVERAIKWQFECKGSSISKGKGHGCKDLQAKSRKEGEHSSRGTYPTEPLQSL